MIKLVQKGASISVSLAATNNAAHGLGSTGRTVKPATYTSGQIHVGVTAIDDFKFK